LIGNGKGQFLKRTASPYRVEVIPHVHGVALGDFNNDGRKDIVTDSWGDDKVEILFGDNKP